MTEEEKKRLEEEKAQQEATDRAIAYARSVGYGVDGQQAPATQPEQPTQPTTQTAAPTTLPAGQTTPAPTVTPTATTQPVQPTTTPATQPIPTAKTTQPRKVGNIKDAYQQRYDDTMAAGEAVIAEGTKAAQNEADFRAKQQADYKAARDAEWQKVLDGQKALVDYWAEQDRAARQRVKEAEEEDRTRTEMENRRAGLVGAGEVAASLINLFSVGSLHASNQVYKDHMQDWMRKADMDRKYRTMRIDQLRERQRGIGDKYATLQAAQTEQAYENWRKNAAEDQKAEADVFNITNNIALKEAQARGEQVEKGGELLTKGATAADQSSQGWAHINQAKENLKWQKDKYAAEMRAEGRNADGSVNPGYVADNAAAAAAANGGSGSSSGSGSKVGGDYYAVVIDGRDMTLRMSKETYEQGIKSGTEEIKEDIAREAAKKLKAAGLDIEGISWDDMVALSAEKKIGTTKDGKPVKIDNPLYGKDQEIIRALNNSGENKEDYEIIERYVKDNKRSVNSFNKHLQMLAGGWNAYGQVPAPQAGTKAPAAADTTAKKSIAEELRSKK